MMNTEERMHVLKGMDAYGGSFVNALGKALFYADEANSQKIKETWPDYWKQYKEMGEKA